MKGMRPTIRSMSTQRYILSLSPDGRPPSTCLQVRTTIKASSASAASPALSRISAIVQRGRREKRAAGNLHGHQANGATPAEADAEAAEQAGIQPVGPPFDLGQDHGIVFRQAWRDGFADFLGLLGGLAIDSGGGNSLEIGILAGTESVKTLPRGGRGRCRYLAAKLVFDGLAQDLLENGLQDDSGHGGGRSTQLADTRKGKAVVLAKRKCARGRATARGGWVLIRLPVEHPLTLCRAASGSGGSAVSDGPADTTREGRKAGEWTGVCNAMQKRRWRGKEPSHTPDIRYGGLGL